MNEFSILCAVYWALVVLPAGHGIAWFRCLRLIREGKLAANCAGAG